MYNKNYVQKEAENIILRKATLQDKAMLEYWDTKPHVIASSPNETNDWQSMLSIDAHWWQAFIAELDGRPIGYILLIDPNEEESHYWGEVEPNLRAIDIWIGEETDLGKGYGTIMMQLAIEKCFSVPEVTGILIDPLVANLRAIKFYRQMGFYELGERRFDEDICLVMRLDRMR